jgi:membrane protein DedA with SNARE-associated domain
MDSKFDWIRRIAVALFVAATLSSALLGIRTYRSFLLLRSAYDAGAPMTSSIRPWMTLDYVAGTYRVSEAALVERLELTPGTNPNTTLRSLAQQQGLSLLEYVQRVQRTISGIAPNLDSGSADKESSWLGAIGDATLGAVLTYEYPSLGLTVFLGSVGLPLPSGIVMTVAGSLAAQGRMDWVWAGVATVVASVLGDIVGYGLGRLLDREALERRGRWLGYTRERALRVKGLFEQWGSWTVLITRTFVSHVSPAVNLLAGAAGYPLSRFLALTVLGRLIWTSAYLGLGYGVGSDPEAATGFLANLSGLLISLAVLAASWLTASGRTLVPLRQDAPPP